MSKDFDRTRPEDVWWDHRYLVGMAGPGTELVWADTWEDAYRQFGHWLRSVDHVARMWSADGERVTLRQVIDGTIAELGEDGYLELIMDSEVQ